MDEAHRQHFNITFAILALAGMSFALLQSLVLPALRPIQLDLHTTPTAAAWILTAYLLSASVATPIAGRLGDMFGKKRTLIVVLAVLAVGTLISAVSTSIGPMIAGRVIQGAGGAIFPLAFGIIRDEFPADRRAAGIALISAILGVGGGAGIVLAGPITQQLSYHWLFWLPLAAVLITIVSAVFFIPESPVRTPGTVNWTASALLSGWLVALLIGVSEGQSWGWSSARLVGVLVIAAVVCAAWIWVELRAREPLVDMKMMRIRGVWTTNAVALLLGFGMYASFILLPQFVEAPARAGYGFGASVTQAGLFLVPTTVAMLIVSTQTGRLEKLFGSKPLLLVGAGLAFASFATLAVARGQRWEIYVASALLGSGIGLAFAAMANLIIENVGAGQTGVATGMNTVTRTVGGGFGGAATASLLAGTVGLSGYPTAHGYTAAFAVCAVALAVGVVVGLGIPQRRPEAAFGPHAVGDPVESAS